jgi:tellurite resistance protein
VPCSTRGLAPDVRDRQIFHRSDRGSAPDSRLAPPWIAQAILAVAAVSWPAVLARLLASALGRGGALRGDLNHPALSPFPSLALITPMVLASAGVAPHAPAVGAVLTNLFIVLTVLHGASITGRRW